MGDKERKHHYQANVRVGKTVVFTTLGSNYDELVAAVNARVETEGSSTEGEILDLDTQEIVYRCRKQAASE